MKLERHFKYEISEKPPGNKKLGKTTQVWIVEAFFLIVGYQIMSRVSHKNDGPSFSLWDDVSISEVGKCMPGWVFKGKNGFSRFRA